MSWLYCSWTRTINQQQYVCGSFSGNASDHMTRCLLDRIIGVPIWQPPQGEPSPGGLCHAPCPMPLSVPFLFWGPTSFAHEIETPMQPVSLWFFLCQPSEEAHKEQEKWRKKLKKCFLGRLGLKSLLAATLVWSYFLPYRHTKNKNWGKVVKVQQLFSQGSGARAC